MGYSYWGADYSYEIIFKGINIKEWDIRSYLNYWKRIKYQIVGC
jgi:hypothetical protein